MNKIAKYIYAFSISSCLIVVVNSSIADLRNSEKFSISDFEDGKFWGYQWGTEKFTAIGVSDEQHHGGKRSLKLSWKFANKGMAALGHTFTGPGMPERFTLWVYGQNSGGILKANLVDGTGEVFVHVLGKIDWDGWREITVPVAATPTRWGGNADGVVDPKAVIRDLTVEWMPGSKPEGTIYIDDVSMETIIPEYGDGAIRYSGPSFFQQNATTQFPFMVRGYRNPEKREFVVKVEYSSGDGKYRSQGAGTVYLQHDKDVMVEIPLTTDLSRQAKLIATLETPNGQVISQTAANVFGLPDISNATFEPESVFGVCFNSIDEHPIMRVGAVKWIRTDIDFLPEHLTSEKAFDSTVKSFNQVVEQAARNKIMMLGILNPRKFITMYQPGTLGTDENKAATLEAWGQWVYKVVSRLKGKVNYWEICNEPNCWKNPELYMAIAKTAYVMGKKADPNCKFGAFATAGIDIPFIELCLKAGLQDYYDFVTIHPYQWSHNFNDLLLTEETGSLEGVLRSYGGSRPIWISEIGWPTHPQGGTPIDIQGEIAGQVYLTLLGLEKYKAFWYTVSDWAGEPTDQEANFGMFDGAGRPKPAFYSYYTVAKVLSGARSLGIAKLPIGFSGWQYLLKDGKRAMAIWRRDRVKTEIKMALLGITGTSVEKYAMDLSREKVEAKNGSITVTAGGSPIICVYSSNSKMNVRPWPRLADDFPRNANPIFLVAPKLPTYYAGAEGIISFGLVNFSDTDVKDTVYVRLPEEMGGKIVQSDLIASKGKETVGQVKFVVPNNIKKGKYTLRLKCAGCRDLNLELEVGSQVSVAVEPINISVACGKVPVKMILKNASNVRMSGNLTLQAEGMKISPLPDVSVDFAPGEVVHVERVIEGKELPAELALEIKGKIGSQSIDIKSLIDSTYITPAQKIVVDAKLNEWEKVPVFHLGRIEQVKPMQTWWNGPNDLSAKVQWQWDREYLYFAADVIDDVHCQNATGGGMWMGDGFQIAFGVENTFSYEMCLAHTNNGPEIFCLKAIKGPTGYIQDAKVMTRRDGKHTIYEVAIPWSVMPAIRPDAGKNIHMNFILNDNDGTTRKGFLECREGIGESKSTDTWYYWQLGRN